MIKFLRNSIAILVIALLFVGGFVSADREFSLPDQTGNSGKFLQTDGVNPLWAVAGGGGGGTVTSVSGINSITATPNPIIGAGTLQLVGDSAAPGNFKYYGTNGTGVKAWYTSFDVCPNALVNQIVYSDGTKCIGDAQFTRNTVNKETAIETNLTVDPFETFGHYNNSALFGGLLKSANMLHSDPTNNLESFVIVGDGTAIDPSLASIAGMHSGNTATGVNTNILVTPPEINLQATGAVNSWDYNHNSAGSGWAWNSNNVAQFDPTSTVKKFQVGSAALPDFSIQQYVALVGITAQRDLIAYQSTATAFNMFVGTPLPLVGNLTGTNNWIGSGISNITGAARQNTSWGFGACATVTTEERDTCLGMGADITAGNIQSIALGRGSVTTSSNQMVVGSITAPIGEVVLGGNGVANAAPYSALWRATNASGTDTNGATTAFAASASTGTGTGGNFKIYATPPDTISGAGLNSYVTGVNVDAFNNLGLSVSIGDAENQKQKTRIMVDDANKVITNSTDGDFLVAAATGTNRWMILDPLSGSLDLGDIDSAGTDILMRMQNSTFDFYGDQFNIKATPSPTGDNNFQLNTGVNPSLLLGDNGLVGNKTQFNYSDTNQEVILKNVHLTYTQDTAPTTSMAGTSLNDGAGAGASCTITTGSTDMSGEIVVTAGNGIPTAGRACKLVFNFVNTTPTSAHLTQSSVNITYNGEYVSSMATDGFEIWYSVALLPGESISYFYQVN